MRNMNRSNVSIKKKLSICIVTLDDRENLIKTLSSVEFSEEIEIIIQDGGSSYDVLNETKRFKSLEPIISFKSQKDRGIYDAMNKAVKRCNSNFVIFLNCGDCIAESMQQTLLNVLDKVDARFNCIKFLAHVRGEGINIERSSQMYFFRRMLNHQSIIYRKSIFSDIIFDPKMKIAGDLRHFLEANLHEKIGYIDLVLIDYLNGGAASNLKGIRQNWVDRSSSWRWRITLSQKLIIMFGVLIRFSLYITGIKK